MASTLKVLLPYLIQSQVREEVSGSSLDEPTWKILPLIRHLRNELTYRAESFEITL